MTFAEITRARLFRAAIAAALVVGTALTGAGSAGAAEDGTTPVRLIAINDLHGNLEPPSGSNGKVQLPDGSSVDAGGAAYLSTHLKQLRAAVPNSAVLSGGDNIGASPVTSALFHDEPTIDYLNTLGMTGSAAGNHEFDEGYQELQRMQFGGCHPKDGCQFRDSFPGANFPFLSANITKEDGTPALLPFTITMSGGVPIGVIGATVKDLPTLVSGDALKGLKVGPEIDAINRTADWLDQLGVKAQVVTMHQGDSSAPGGPNDCKVTPGPASEIAAKASPKVDAIISAHSHQAYNCQVNDPAGNPRPLMQGASYGRLLQVIDLKIDRHTRDVVRPKTEAHNEVVTRDVPQDPETVKLVDEAKTKVAPIANKPVGSIKADLTKAGGQTGESTLGDVIADGQLAATKQNGAQVALTNPGGIRADLNFKSSPANEGDGVVTYGEAYAVQPFGNVMQTITMTGEQLKAALEQQWQGADTRMLQVSSSLHYSYSAGAAQGSRVSDLTIDGKPVDPAGKYRVSANNFLTGGGDGFSEFTKGTEMAGGPVDLDAMIAYFGANPGIAPPPADRITAK